MLHKNARELQKELEAKEMFVTRLRWLLLALVGVVILEGLIRKLFGSAVGNLVFFSKDGLVFLMGAMLLFHKFEGPIAVFHSAYSWFFIGMLVPLAMTLNKDPVLAVFGFKQYALFPFIVFAVVEAFRGASRREFRRFIQFPVLLLIPVSVLAQLQLHLGAGNWLNMTVGGTDMSAFAAGGHLRVSATFPFVAQFAWYLNAMTYMIAVYFFVRQEQTKTALYVSLTLCVLLILSSFVTASRTAVLGNTTIIGIAGVLLMFKGDGRSSASFLGIVLMGAVAFLAARHYFPDAFQGYAARSGGTVIGAQSQKSEIQGRMMQAFFNWMDGLDGAPPTTFGYGLGVMSNGSDKVSHYAADWRNRGTWGEVDLSNTLFEGGWYLVCIWMAFRLFTIVFILERVMRLRDPQLAIAGCVGGAYIIIEGATGALGIQPPLSIWFWLAVGTVMVLEQLDQKSAEEKASSARAGTARPGIRPRPRPARPFK